jgi:hypothetical protein
MRRTLLIGALLVSAPLGAQESRVYTNADLVQGPVKWTHAVTEDELQSLAANQFRLPGPLPNGPQVVGVMSSPTAGPFGEFPRYAGGDRLDVWPVNPYLGPIGSGFRFHRGFSQFRDSPSPQPHTPPPPRAPVVATRVITMPAGAGVRRPR